MKIAVASEHRGYFAKAGILRQLNELHHEAIDYGTDSQELCDYPDFAAKAARDVSDGVIDRAILIGGTGIGMCIVANKFPGVRAALCHDDLSADISRRYNDANILCLSAELFNGNLASRMIQIWLDAPFEGRRHARRLAKIKEIEQSVYKTRHNSSTNRP